MGLVLPHVSTLFTKFPTWAWSRGSEEGTDVRKFLLE